MVLPTSLPKSSSRGSRTWRSGWSSVSCITVTRDLRKTMQGLLCRPWEHGEEMLCMVATPSLRFCYLFCGKKAMARRDVTFSIYINLHDVLAECAFPFDGAGNATRDDKNANRFLSLIAAGVAPSSVISSFVSTL